MADVAVAPWEVALLLLACDFCTKRMPLTVLGLAGVCSKSPRTESRALGKLSDAVWCSCLSAASAPHAPSPAALEQCQRARTPTGDDTYIQPAQKPMSGVHL